MRLNLESNLIMPENHKRILKVFLISVVSCAGIVYLAQGNQTNESRWESRIQAFETQDQDSFPPSNAILFVGSSSIVFWRSLADDMAPLTVINRGFGGSQMFELNQFRDRIVVPYKPKAVLVYEGDNDVASGKDPDEILSEYQDFLSHLHKNLPETDVYLIAVKPSISRKHLWPVMQDVNRRLQVLATQHGHVEFLDIATPMLNDDGSINPDLFVADNLHMNAAGYAIWTEVIRPKLMARYRD